MSQPMSKVRIFMVSGIELGDTFLSLRVTPEGALEVNDGKGCGILVAPGKWEYVVRYYSEEEEP